MRYLLRTTIGDFDIEAKHLLLPRKGEIVRIAVGDFMITKVTYDYVSEELILEGAKLS